MKKQIAILLIFLLLLSGCKSTGASEELGVSDRMDQDFSVGEIDPGTSETPSQKEPSPEEPSDAEEPSKEEQPKEEQPEETPKEENPKEETTDQKEEGTPQETPAEDEDMKEKTTVKLLSLNIRHSQEQEPNTKEKRLVRIGKLIADYSPAVVGLQEIRPWWVNETEDQDPGLPDVIPEGYEMILYYRDELFITSDPTIGNHNREGCAILYDTAVVDLLKEGTFWISDHPDRESKWETADTYRNAVWAKFKIKESGEEFYFCSAHFTTTDDLHPKSVQCLNDELQKIAKKYGDAPIVACGDLNFNRRDSSLGYQELQQYFIDVGREMDNDTSTFPNFGNNAWDCDARGDYFLLQGDWHPIAYEVDTRVYDPITEEPLQLNYQPSKHAFGYYSDHAPIYTELQFD